MAYERLLEGPLDYAPCRYGKSKLLFRGPRRTLRGDYVSFLGSNLTYGRFIKSPYPDLVGRDMGITPLNLGFANAGVDTFHDDQTVQDLVSGGRAVVVEVMGAHKLSNRLYTVHPRRNDRFLAASKLLVSMFPEADFADIHFTRHLLSVLRDLSTRRFNHVVEELRETWVSRMGSLIARAGVPVVLLWVSTRSPDEESRLPTAVDPLYVTREMLDRLADQVAHYAELIVEPAREEPHRGMIFSELEVPAAMKLPGPDTHVRIAEELSPALMARIQAGKGPRGSDLAGPRSRRLTWFTAFRSTPAPR